MARNTIQNCLRHVGSVMVIVDFKIKYAMKDVRKMSIKKNGAGMGIYRRWLSYRRGACLVKVSDNQFYDSDTKNRCTKNIKNDQKNFRKFLKKTYNKDEH